MAAEQPLPGVFHKLPDFLTQGDKHKDLVEMHAVLLKRLQDESIGVGLTTIQQLLLERIAFNYVIVRWRETTMGSDTGFENAKHHKDFNTYWLSMTQEWHRVLQSKTSDHVRHALLEAVGSAMSKAFEGLHEDVALPLKERFASAFADMGL